MKQKFILGDDGLFYPENEPQQTGNNNSNFDFGGGFVMTIIVFLFLYLASGSKVACKKGGYWEQVQENLNNQKHKK